MTPSPNVEALAALLAGYFAETGIEDIPAMPLAERLASRGVLATEALTDETLEDLWADGKEYDGCDPDYCVPAKFRAALARLARGEP